MRINPNVVPDMLAAIQQSESSLQTALQEVSTGRSVNLPSDNPSASADMVQNTLETAAVDQYTQNVSSVLSTVQTADSALSSVVSSLTQAISLGTEGANGTSSAANRQAIAVQVQGILSNVASEANQSYRGAYLFGGTANTTLPYTVDSTSATGYTYNGNNNANSVRVGDNLSVQVSLPGSQIFSDSGISVFGSLNSLVAALQSGNTSDIATATTAVSSALSYVSQQRVVFGNSESQLNAQETCLQQETVSLSSQATAIVGISMAQAAENLVQAETANNAALAAAAKVMPNSLLNYLSTPN
jgi:flagellar hook-associated protein 3 FlgL